MRKRFVDGIQVADLPFISMRSWERWERYKDILFKMVYLKWHKGGFNFGG